MVDKLKLLAGDEKIEVDGIVFKQPKLRDIKDLGCNLYYTYISFLIIDVEEYLTTIKREDLIPVFRQHNLTMFDIYKDNSYERQFFIEALSFFVASKVEFKDGEFVINDIILDLPKYRKIIQIIGEINYLNIEDKHEFYANEKARQIAEKIRKAKEKRKKTQQKDSITLPDIISAVASRKESLNLLNIWDLTIYQLYDHYSRLIAEDNFDICAMNYAYWGGEFKCKHWSNSIAI